MSATIKYKVVKPADGHLDISAPSAFIEGLCKAFDCGLPETFGTSDIPTLKGMASIDGQYNELIECIEKHGTVEIWAQY